MESKKTGAFCDKECTCECGNKHECYGGIGYTTTVIEAYTREHGSNGYYRHAAKCNKCGVISELVY